MSDRGSSPCSSLNMRRTRECPKFSSSITLHPTVSEQESISVILLNMRRIRKRLPCRFRGMTLETRGGSVEPTILSRKPYDITIQGHFRLLSLLLEVRLDIFRKFTYTELSKQLVLERKIPPLLRASRTICAEALPLLYDSRPKQFVLSALIDY